MKILEVTSVHYMVVKTDKGVFRKDSNCDWRKQKHDTSSWDKVQEKGLVSKLSNMYDEYMLEAAGSCREY